MQVSWLMTVLFDSPTFDDSLEAPKRKMILFSPSVHLKNTNTSHSELK